MNTPPRLLNSAMSLSSMCAVAGGEMSSSSFCLPSTGFSPIHCYSSLAELSLSSSSLDVTIPFITTTTTTTTTTTSGNNVNNLSQNNNNSHHNNSGNSLLASPVVSRSPRLLDSPSLMNHDLFISPIRNSSHNVHNQSLLLQTPTHSLSEAPHMSISPASSSSSTNHVMVATTSSHSFQPAILLQNRQKKQQKTAKPKRVSSSVNVNNSHINEVSNNNAMLAPAHIPATSSTSSVLASILQQAPMRQPVLPLPRPSKPRPPPPKIAPAPAPGVRNNSNVVQQQQQRQQQQPATTGGRGRGRGAKGQASRNQQPTLIPIAAPSTSFAPLLISQAQPTAVQGLLIQVPTTMQHQQTAPVLLAIAPQQAPQPLLIMAPNQTFETPLRQQQVATFMETATTMGSFPTANFLTVSSGHENAVILSDNAPSVVQTAPPKRISKPVSSFQPQRVSSNPRKVTVTTSRNLADEDIPTKSINLENLNCARSLVVFPPTLPAFTTSAKRNFNYMNDMSMSRLSLLASPTGGSQTPSLNSGPSSPLNTSNLLSLSPTLTNDNNPISLVENPPAGSMPGLTPAQLAQQMRLADAVHLASDTTIAGINIGKLLDAVRRCRERRTRFGIAQQEVSNNLVPVHGEMFRQASICKLENFSLKLEVASRMVAILEPFYDGKEVEFNNRMAVDSPEQQPAIPKPHPRTKFFNRHSQRHSFTDEARDLLRSVFANNAYPNRKAMLEISEKLGVPRGVVRVWFANRRLEQNKRIKAGSLQTGVTAGQAMTVSSGGGKPIYAKPARTAKETSPVPRIAMDHSDSNNGGGNNANNSKINDEDDDDDLFFLDDQQSSSGLSFFGT